MRPRIPGPHAPTFRTYKRVQAQLFVAACNVLMQYLSISGRSEHTLFEKCSIHRSAVSTDYCVSLNAVPTE